MMPVRGSEAVRRALSVEQAALDLGIGRSLAYELVRAGKLRSVRAGQRILIPVSALEEFLAAEPTGE